MSRRLVRSVAVAACFFAAAAFAQTQPPEIVRGLTWLTGQAQPNGSLAGEATSIALPLQAQAETVAALGLFATVPTAVVARVEADRTPATEFLARRVLTSYTALHDASTPMADLAAFRNPDGGYASSVGYASEPLDTAFALQALSRAEGADAVSANAAIAYLQSTRHADGGWGIDEQGSVYVTANVLIAAQAWSTRLSVGNIASPAKDWLLAQRDASHAYATAFDDAIALIALSTQTAQADVLQPLSDALRASQQADGSWGADPYVTALALRAFWSVTHSTPPSTTASITGKVVDAASGTPLPGVTVQRSSDAAVVATTAADGSFSVTAVAPGSIALKVSKLGYASVNVSGSVAAGQVLQLGTIRLAAASLTADLSGVVRDNNNNVLSGVTVSVGAASTQTDASGAYALNTLDAGAATIQVAKPNYRTVSASVSFVAGQHYSYSPTLYPDSVTPPTTATLRGGIVDGVTHQAIAGATIGFGTAAATSASNGRFEMTGLHDGAFTLAISANGYQSVGASGTLSNGINDIGTIALTKVPASSTLSGLVSDAASGVPIAGASLSVEGQAATAVSGADGRYALGGVIGTQFTLLVTAPGYLGNRLGVSLPQAGDNTLDVRLTAAQASGLVFDEVRTDKPVYGPSDMIELEVEVRNTTTTSADLIVDADVLDSQGHVAFVFKANAHGFGQFPPNLPLTFPASTTTPVEMDWSANRLAAGTYTIYARGSDASGRVLADGSTQFTVRSEPVLRGGVVTDPPLAQAGSGVPVHLSADLLNVGNEDLPAGDLSLSIILDHPDTQTSTIPQASASTVLRGAPLTNARGLVRDAQGMLYTANYYDRKVLKIDPQLGTASVLATVPDSPVGVAIDAQDTLWVASNTRRVSTVTQAGVLGSFNVAKLTSLTAIDVDAAGNAVLSGSYSGVDTGGLTEQRLVRRAPDGTESVLWRNGLAQPVAMIKDAGGGFIVSNYADNTLAKVSAQGAVTPFATGLNRPQGITSDGAGIVYVANSGDGTIAKVTPDGQVSVYATGLQQPADLKLDAGGTLYVSNQGNDTIVAISPSGQQQVVARGIANTPEGMKYDAAGNLYTANDDGTLRMKGVDGSVQTLATGLVTPRGLALDASGSVFVANYSNGTISKVVGTTRTTFASGLVNPYGVAIDDQGQVNVTEYGVNRISRFDADGHPSGTTESMLNSPAQLRIDAQGRVFVANSNFISVIEGGVPRILARNFAATSMAADMVNGGLLALRGYDLYRIALDGSMSKLATLSFYPYDVAVNAAGEAIVRDYSGKRLYKLDAAGAASVFAQLPDYPSQLINDLAGNLFVRLNSGVLYRVAGDGSLSPIAITLNEYLYGFGVGADGRLLTWTNYSRVYAIDATTGVATKLRDNAYPQGLTLDANGRLILSFSSSQEVDTYDAAGNAVARLDGFLNPWDMLWDGSQLKFVDSGGRFYAMSPGGYPVKLGNFNVSYLAKAGAEIIGSAGGRIVRWTGSAAADYAGLGGASLLGVAGRADGGFAAAVNATSRIIEFSAARQVSADYAGIVKPMGLAFDAQGRLHVANYGSSTVARLDANGVTTTVATVSGSRYLAFDDSGNLWISRSGGVTRQTPAGVASNIGDATNVLGVLVDGAQAYAVDQSYAQLRRLNGATWTPFATGLSNPVAVRVGDGDSIYVANRSSNVVARYSSGHLDTLAINLSGLNALARDASGTLYAAGNTGLVAQIDADGTTHNLHVQEAMNESPLYGLVIASATRQYAISDAVLYGISVTQATTPPVAGSVVYTTTRPMAALASGDDYAHFDFGDWLPPYGGDFRVVVERQGIREAATNFVHVGPHASAELSAAQSELPPGDQSLAMCMNLSGADFTAISRVEVDQVRNLATIASPYGIAADRAGNLYFTDSTSLYRTDVQGTTSKVVGNLAPAYGLAADDGENLYIASRNATTGRYNLMRVDHAGNASVVVDLGVTSANGVAVNSHNDVFVGSPGKLLKVTQAGVLSTLSTSGLPSPRGLAIDGRDNIYVQNNSGYVSLIRQDGSVTDLYTTADGVNDPAFEGDGYPNIAADCADNVYVASSQWSHLGIQPNEEHTVAQIVARTGHAAMVFDTLQINSTLNDIDYLAFDRFGSRLLLWNHYYSQIWQAPVTCGAIGVDAHVMTSPGQTLTGMTKAPAAVVPQADGRTEYVWSLRDVGADGASVCFDTTLRGLILGERRKSVDASFINFRNSFASNDVTLPVPVPLITVGNLVGLGVVTDQAEYPANATARITTTLTNSNAVTVSGVLKVDVYDAHGAFVGAVQQQDVTIPANGQLPVDGTFAIGAILAGGYNVHAVLSDNGLAVAQADTPFAVLAANTQALATTQVATDKLAYQSNDHVLISSRVTSLSANVVLENLTLTLQVYDAADTLLFTRGYPISQLLPAAQKAFVTTQALQNAPAGIYRVRQTLTDAAGHVLDVQQTSYQVGSSGETGFGLVGTLAADPVEVAVGNPVQLSGTATNHGNADMHAVPLTLVVIDAQQSVVWTWNTTSDIAMGSSVPVEQPWSTVATPAGSYVAVLKASIGGQDRVLAQTTVRVTAPSIHLDASISLAAHAQLSALVLIDPVTATPDQDRVRTELTAIGYASTFVSTAADFGAALRSGNFQLYLVLANSVSLDATTERLLREAVHRGDGLVVGTAGAALSETLAQLSGLKPGNALTPIDMAALTIAANAPGGPAHLPVSPVLPSRIVETTSASVLAELEGRFANGATIGTLAQALAAQLRVDVGYAGTDAGTNGSHLELTSVGRLHNPDGSDSGTVWRVRNSGNNARSLLLASADATWTAQFASAAHTDAFIASPVVAGTAAHRLDENGATIQSVVAIATLFADSRRIDIGANPGAIALWANSAVAGGDALEWTGSQHSSYGAVHSNSGMRWSGAQNLIDGPVHYVTSFMNSGSQNTFTLTPRVVPVQPLPQLTNLDDFRPGGPVQAALGSAYLDQSAECAKSQRWQRNGSRVTLAPGVYWIPCDVKMAGSSFSGNVTLVSTGSIQLSGSSATFQAFYKGLQFATSRHDVDAVKLATSSMTLDGYVFAPAGGIEASGSNSLFNCSLIGDTIRMAGAKITIDPRNCAYAGIERRAPAVLWNAFGAGWSGYAAFDWLKALNVIDAAGSGPFGHLFGGVLDHVAPDAPTLRSGSQVPVAAMVQNHGDAFQGKLLLEAQGDAAVLVPGTPEWLLDFNHAATFDATAIVQLGSGASTTLQAHVAALVPLAVDPLAQASLSIPHVAGETLAALTGALAAQPGRDAPLDSALANLQAAQTAQAGGDRPTEIQRLLDAAEYAGRSTHVQADAYRTRIDWVLWRESR